MRSNICHTFFDGVPLSPNNQVSTIMLNFTAQFWQPFIDINDTSDYEKHICGPFLGIITEFAKLYNFNLVYRRNVQDNTPGEYPEYFNMLDRGEVNLFLWPLPYPQLVNNSDFLVPSRVITDNAMVSILAPKFHMNSLFHWLLAFDIGTWTAIAALYLLLATISSIILKDSRVFFDYFGLAFNQGLSASRMERTPVFTIFWIIGSLITIWAYSGLLLSLVLMAPPMDKIDSIEDLVRRGCKFGVWEGETAHEVVTDPSGEHYHQLKNRFVDLRNSTIRQLNRDLLRNGFRTGRWALMTDRYFNEYQFATRLNQTRNLYLSKLNSNVVPMFMALKKMNQDKINTGINHVIDCLTRSGIFDHWLKSTIDLNNDALKAGVIDSDDDKRDEYSNISSENLVPVFYLIFLSMVLSFMVFLLEILVLFLFFKAGTVQNL